MALDFSKLHAALDLSVMEGETFPSTGDQGKLLELLIADVEEDPNQPRIEFPEADMLEMELSIKTRGVKTPVSVKPHPTKPGKWLLNNGARRYRGSIRAGKLAIPAFVDRDHDEYDQVMVNIQHQTHTPMELAGFIKKRLAKGDKKAEIARRLGIDKSEITHHCALIDPPECIEELYSTGRCTSARYLFELRNLYEKFPSKIASWCAGAQDVNRKTVSVLGEALKGNEIPQANACVSPPAVDPATDKPAHARVVLGETAPAEVRPVWPAANQAPVAIVNPELQVSHDGKSAVILLDRMPSALGSIHIRYLADGAQAEVSGQSVIILSLAEAGCV